MRFDIVPAVSVNNIPFGASREEVRNALGEYEEFKKDEDDKVTTDDFDFCHVFYDDEDEEDEEIAESVVFAKKGYYDEFLLD